MPPRTKPRPARRRPPPRRTTTTTTTRPARRYSATTTGEPTSTFPVATAEGTVDLSNVTPRQIREWIEAGQIDPNTGKIIPTTPAGAIGGWIGDLLRGLLPVLKVGAGGLGMIAVGGALVWVAGRRGPVAQATKAVATPAQTIAQRVAPKRRKAENGDVSDQEYFERRGMERAARQSGAKLPSYEGVGKRLPRKRPMS